MFMTSNHLEPDGSAIATGPTYRLVADMAKMEESYLLGDVGESASVFSEHYGDFIDAQLNGRYHKFTYTPKGRTIILIP